MWSPEGNRIFYWKGKSMMMAAISRDPSMRVVSRQALFSGNYLQDYDIAPSGDRMLMIQTLPGLGELVVIPNWATKLKATVR